MLAQTCQNIGKPVIENANCQSQEPSVPISPSCSSSCSAPKFSPHSFEYSPVEQSKLMDEAIKDKSSSKEKPKKRKSQKKETEIPLKRPPLDPQTLNSNYAISEFLKISNFSRDSFPKPDPTNAANPIYNHLINPTNHSQFSHTSSLWKSKPMPNSRMFFPMNYGPPNYPHPNIPIQNGLYRGPPANILHDINQFYSPCQVDKSPCDCIICHNRKNAIDKNLMKIEPLLFNFFHGIYKERNLSSNMPLLTFLQNSNNSSGASAIKFCMYCGQCIPLLQNLLNHIHSEHIDSVNANVCPKIENVGSFSSNFNIENLQSKDLNINDLHALKNLELLKQLQFLYNSEAQLDNCADKSILMK